MLAARPAGSWRVLKAIMAMEDRGRKTPQHLLLMLCASQLLSETRKHNVEHVHVHSCANSALVAAFCRLLGGPTYSLTLHNPLMVFGPNQRLKWRHAAFAIVITQILMEEVKQELAGDLPPRVEIAPMGVDLEKFQRQSAYRPWTGEGPCRIFCCGRLHPAKCHDVLIQAVGLLRDRGHDVHLVIAGEDLETKQASYRKKLEEQIVAQDLSDRVKLIGSVSEERIRDELERAHLFSLASWSEPLGVAIMEAMSMSVPVVVTAAGGVGELVTDGESGVMVQPLDVEWLAQGIEKVMKRPELASSLGEVARRVVEEKFGSERSARLLVDCVQDLEKGLIKASPH